MTIRKETELMHSIIIYCLRCQEEGDFHALKEMGFGPREMRALNALSSGDQIRLASTKSHFMKIVLNQDVYWRMIDYVDQENLKEAVINQLIAFDAPLPLMNALTGIGSKQYALKRRQAGLLGSPVGRPPIPSDSTTQLVWQQLTAITEKSDSFGPKQFLDLYESMDRKVSLRVIWNLFHRWEDEGALKVNRGPITSRQSSARHKVR
ncbi:MAG: DUF2857 domain-containing protein [Acidiferrobacterales bacterium]|nr:DUF2857 domain-containing protein [Acidiferrobacterales bacterium]